jgi:hypothetical protein
MPRPLLREFVRSCNVVYWSIPSALNKRNQRVSLDVAAEQLPLYVRWTPDRCQYALEMRLDLVSQLTRDLWEAEGQGIEIGGMLLGTLPDATTPILRVDDVSLISRRLEDGAIYMLDPGQLHRFDEITQAAKLQDKMPVGFFRSHVRPGPLQPSIADKSLLAAQFSQGDYALLLVQSREPRAAGFFLAANGHLPDQSSVRRFIFDAAEFKYLPEIPGEEPEVTEEPSAEPQRERRYHWVTITIVTTLILLALFVAFYGSIRRSLRPSTNKLGLTAASAAGVLKITWDHNAPFVLNARSALMTIDDGARRRELMLRPDELKLGEVDYERLGRKVSITLAIDAPGSDLQPQTVNWDGN